MTEKNELDCCPICDKPFKADDTCATDITEGTCHAACLEGSPVVDLETGEPTDQPVGTFPYSQVMEPAPAATPPPETNLEVGKPTTSRPEASSTVTGALLLSDGALLADTSVPPRRRDEDSE